MMSRIYFKLSKNGRVQMKQEFKAVQAGYFFFGTSLKFSTIKGWSIKKGGVLSV